MKILIVVESHSSRAGGGPIYWAELSSRLIHRGHDVVILSGIEPGAPFASPNTIGFFSVRPDLRRRTPRTLLSRLFFSLRFNPAVRAFARKWKPDIIHTVPPIASEAALGAGKTIGAPVVASVLSHVEAQWKTLEPHPFRSAIFHLLERRAIQRPFSKIICITKHSRKVLLAEGVPPERVVYVPHAVDTEKFNPKVKPLFRDRLELGENSFVIGYAGTLTKDKGIDQLIRSLALLKHRQNLHLILAGVGEDRLYFEQLVLRLGLRNVTFLGAISHDTMPAFMSSLDLYAVPSYTETLPTTVLEALSTGTPVIASAVGGVADFLQNKIGILIQTPEEGEIAQAIDEWLERRTELKQMGNLGRRLVLENHSWQKTSIQTEEVYRQCLKEN